MVKRATSREKQQVKIVVSSNVLSPAERVVCFLNKKHTQLRAAVSDQSVRKMRARDVPKCLLRRFLKPELLVISNFARSGQNDKVLSI